jgi:hypothetical protein
MALHHLCAKWNIPDWRDSAAYPKANALSDTLWRWEFLRRLKAYRDDWTVHAPGTYRYLVSQSGKSEQKQHALTPDHPQFRARAEYLRDSAKPGTEAEREALKCVQSLRKYHVIGGLPNPAIRKPEGLSFDPSFGGFYEGRGDVEELLIEPHHGLYDFDLTRPLPPQLQKARRDLLDQQAWRNGRKEDRRLHRKLFPRYLRALDARDCGATFNEIGEKLLGKVDYDDAAKRGKELYDQAHALQKNLPFYF